MDNTVNPRPNYGGRRKIRGTKNGENHKQAQEPKSNIGDTEENPIVTSTITQEKNPTNTDNNQSKFLSIQLSLGEIGNTGNNARKNTANIATTGTSKK